MSKRPVVMDVARLVGASVPVRVRPYVEYATVDTMRNFARAYGDDNPLYGDEAYGRASMWGSIIAAPLFPIASGVPRNHPDDNYVVRALASLERLPVRVVADVWRFHRAILPGTRLDRSDTVSAAAVEDDEAVSVTIRSSYSAAGATVAVHERTRRYGTRVTQKVARTKANYSDEQLAEIDRLYSLQSRRGSATRTIDEVEIGDGLGPLVKGPLTLTDLVSYRGGVGPGPLGVEPLRLGYLNRLARPGVYDHNDFGAFDAAERLHWDEAYAQAKGHVSAYDYSHTRLTWATQLITDWMGDGGWLASITFTAWENNYVGDTHWMTATVQSCTLRSGNGQVQLSLRGTNQEGRATCSGIASVELPALGAVLPQLSQVAAE